MFATGVTMVDPSGMGETTQALLWVIGLLVCGGGGGWLLAKSHRVKLDPNTVNVETSKCEQTCKDNTKDHENLFLRMNDAEQRLARLEGTYPEIRRTLESLDGKMTTLMLRGWNGSAKMPKPLS